MSHILHFSCFLQLKCYSELFFSMSPLIILYSCTVNILPLPPSFNIAAAALLLRILRILPSFSYHYCSHPETLLSFALSVSSQLQLPSCQGSTPLENYSGGYSTQYFKKQKTFSILKIKNCQFMNSSRSFLRNQKAQFKKKYENITRTVHCANSQAKTILFVSVWTTHFSSFVWPLPKKIEHLLLIIKILNYTSNCAWMQAAASPYSWAPET